ncbi:hypothetical protein KIPB_013764, partial [Kipferlia bialata]
DILFTEFIPVVSESSIERERERQEREANGEGEREGERERNDWEEDELPEGYVLTALGDCVLVTRVSSTGTEYYGSIQVPRPTVILFVRETAEVWIGTSKGSIIIVPLGTTQP